jgi:phosphoglycerol transferase MdoB-like AlkP superfamily enzyme
MNPMYNSSGRWRRVLVPEALFTAGVYVLLLALFAVLRLLLLWRNASMAQQIPAELLTKSFWVGLRFDLAVSSYLLIPFFLLLLVLRGRKRVWLLAGLAAVVGGVIFSSLAEIEFYRELEFRFNTVVFEYLNHPRIVAGMAWEGYPVLRYLLVWSALLSLFAGACSWLYRRILLPAPPAKGASAILARTMGVTLMLAMMVFASRGGFTHEPLRWGDAFFSEEPFANDLALNGIFTMGRSVLEKASGRDKVWTGTLAADEARRLTRQMLLLPHETDLSSADHPILRRESRPADAAPLLRRDPTRPMNVVVILMESFAGRHTGALGAPGGITPDFDALSCQGILFERAFSNGTHTHQGVFASLASFPNLPGFEYLMKTMEAKQEFSGLPSLLNRQGYQTIFLYNGLFSWDNKEGFFRQHGMDRFIGRESYVNPTFVDPVWGVSDYDVLMRANEEFKAMAAKGPFFGAILTLSNHSPFNLPDPLPFARITAGDDLEPRLNSMRYADWALGEFFRQAQREEWFQNTLFVLTGDHGFGSPPALTEMRLDRQHVPLLFYSPALDPAAIGHRRTVASQVDIGASVLGLLGLEVPHQAWGRNLFDPGLADEGFAVVKPSGGDDLVALIEGDYVLIREPKGNTLLYRCDFGFPPRVDLLPKEREAERREAMLKRMQAYVETGLLSLRDRKLGVPEEMKKIGRITPKAFRPYNPPETTL